MFLLHGARRSSASYRARIALNFKGVAYREIFHDLQAGEQSRPEYIAVNPQRLVPSLVCPDGLVLTQSLAIVEYLDETFAEPPLLPNDAAGRARVRALAQVVACDMHPVNNLRVRDHVRELCAGNEGAVAAWMDKWSSLGFRALEKLLAHGQTGAFCHGDTPTMADICLVPQVYNARITGCDLTFYPTVVRIANACEAVTAFAQAHPHRLAP
jgi:maleylpyruvate isomerase